MIYVILIIYLALSVMCLVDEHDRITKDGEDEK